MAVVDNIRKLNSAVHKAMRGDTIDELEKTIRTFNEFISDIPDSSCAYLNQSGTIDIRGIPKGIDQREFEIALQLWDIHSYICSMLLTTIWRTSQLQESLIIALNGQALIVGASASRALFETACAFSVESSIMIDEIINAKREGINDAKDATKFRIKLQNKVIKTAMGTRQASVLADFENFKRINIQTLIDKAMNNLKIHEYYKFYEKLCDAVHPSYESFASFWTEVGVNDSRSQTRWLLNRYAMRPDELIDTIGLVSSWALGQLRNDFFHFFAVCIDLGLAARLPWLLEPDNIEYFGLCKKPELYDICPCMSGKKWKFCKHSLS